MTTTRDHANGWACTDCVMLIANGETPPEMNEEETAAYLALIPEGNITLGRVLGEDGCECEDWNNDVHRERCEHDEFKTSRCDVCKRPNNAGSRDAVTIWL
jgi:ribosomal protein L37AE/L43A